MNQLKTGTFLSYISIVLNNIIGLLYIPFMLRMMGQNEYGLYSLSASTIAYLTVLDFGFSNAIIRYTAKFIAEKKQTEQYEMFGMFFILYCIIGILVFFIGLGIYYNVDALFDTTMNNMELEKVRIMLLLMIFNISFTFPMSIWGAIITAYENFIFQKLINIVRIILNPLVMVLLLYMGYKAIAMVVVITLFNILTLCINAWYCRYRLHIRIKFVRFKWSFLQEIIIYSFWIFLSGIMDRIYWSTGQFLLGIYTGASAVAVYAVAIQLQGIFMSFSTAISGVFLPKVTTMVAKMNNEKSISDLFIRTSRIQYLVVFFILIGFVLFGRQFILLWAGENYEDVYVIALLFFIPLTIPLIQNLGISILQARNQMEFRSILFIIISVGSLGVSIPLTKLYGGIGCAIGVASALIIGQNVIMNMYYYKKIHLDMPRFWYEIGKMSVFPLLLGVLWWLILYYITLNSWFLLTVAIFLFSLTYLPLVWFTSMNSSEQNLFRNPVLKIYYKIIK